jgi:hypothetical protein
MRLACRLVNSGKATEAFQFAKAFEDQVLREETYELIAALSAKTGKPEVAWDVFQDGGLPPTERIALGRGFVAGNQAAKRTAAAAAGKSEQPR